MSVETSEMESVEEAGGGGDTMEEGELSDDGMVEEPQTSTRTPIRMDIPDLLKELTGAEDFNKVDPETVTRMAARAERFNMEGNSVSFEEISNLYSFMQVSQSERDSIDRLEMIYVWTPAKLELADVQAYFAPHHPLTVDLVSRNSCHVVWATSVNCARAMLSLSRGVGVASTERVVKHVLGAEDDSSFVTENEVGVDLVHPDDIGVEFPQEDGPWRLANTEAGEAVMLLRFGRRTDLSMRERQAAARHVGILSKSRREELLQEQEKALQKEAERKKPVDKKNPWGTAAESWAIETRGRVGTDFDDFLAAYSRDRRAKRDWDNPEEEETISTETKKAGGVRSRLGWSRGEEDGEGEGEDMEWDTRMKKPRMGMVADIVEKGSARSRLGGGGDAGYRRKPPRRSDELDEPDMYQDLRQKVRVEDRVIRTAGRRLNDRFAGGRLEGRLGFGGAGEAGSRSRLGDRLGASRHQEVVQVEDEDDEGGLERDNGDDIRGMELVNNMVIKVTRSGDDIRHQDQDQVSVRVRRADSERDRDRGRERIGEKNKHTEEERERAIRQRLKEIKREKELIDVEKRRKHESPGEPRRERDTRRQEELASGSKLADQIKERAKRLQKYKSKRKDASSDESESESSESDNTDSDSSEESSESESESSESESQDSSSDDSEEERQRRRRKDKERSTRPKHSSSSKRRSLESSSRSANKISEKKSSKSSGKRETNEEKKAAELRDQLRNYLKKAKEAKEKKKK